MGILTDDMKRLIDEQKLAFQPQTIANIRAGSLVEVNVVDPERMRADGSKLTERVEAIVVINVQHAAPLVSAPYDDGATTEAEMLETQRARFSRLHARG